MSMLYPLAHLGLGRAAVLTHETATARKAYDQFLTLWKNADTGLRAVTEARSEQSMLR